MSRQAFDTGPLTWVKGEIDLALERAQEALERYREQQDSTQLRFCRTHLHQVHGALEMIDLHGLPQVTQSLENLLTAIEQGALEATAERLLVAEQALTTIRHYLDALLNGQAHQPMYLLPLLQEISRAHGLGPVSPAVLFFPDLNVRPPRRAEPPAPENADLATDPATDAEALRRLIKRERAQFQQGLLAWLRHPPQSQDAQSGISRMYNTVKVIAASRASSATRTFWWVTLGLLDGLRLPHWHEDPQQESEIRSLLGRIDLQIRRLQDGAPGVPERVMRETLYHIALIPDAQAAENPLLQEIRQAFDLAALLPASEAAPAVAAPDPQADLLRQLDEKLGSTEALWNKCCSGNTTHLAGFTSHVTDLHGIVAQLEQTDLKRLSQALVSTAHWLTDQPATLTDTVGAEMSTALLLLKTAAAQVRELEADFAQQVDYMVQRLHGCILGRLPGASTDMPLLNEISRQARARRQIGLVARDIRSHLAQIEQILDTFFRQPARHDDLQQLEQPLQQTADALSRIGQAQARAYLDATAQRIRALRQPEPAPTQADFEIIAERLSALGFFIDRLPNGTLDFAAFLNELQQDAALPAEVLAVPEAAGVAGMADVLPAAVSGETPAGVPAGRSTPAEAGGEMAANTAATRAVAAGADTVAEETAVDPQLLDIFLDEAREVLQTLHDHLAKLHVDPLDHAALVTIRRGTHTLKGSGRMVGLTDFGETAWAVEQTLNLWLRQETPVNADLLRLLDLEGRIFTDWIAHLGGPEPRPPLPEATPLVQLAEQLRGSEPLPAPVAPVLPVFSAPPPEPAETAHGETARPAAACQKLKISPALYGIFSNEASEHLQGLQHALSLLQANPDLPTPEGMARAAHTLGGISSTVGLDCIHKLCQALEHALLRRDAAPEPMHREGIPHLEQTLETLAAQLAGLPHQQPDPQPQQIAALNQLYPVPLPDPESQAIAASRPLPVRPALTDPAGLPADELDAALLPVFLEEASDLIQGFENHIHDWRAQPQQSEAAHGLARLLHTFKGGARMAGAMQLGEMTHRVETRLEQALSQQQVDVALIDEIEAACDGLVGRLERLQAASVRLAAVPKADATSATLPNSRLKLDVRDALGALGLPPRKPTLVAVPPPAGVAASSLPVAPEAGEAEPLLPPAMPVMAEEAGLEGSTTATASVPANAAPAALQPEDGSQRPLLRVRADLVDQLVNEAGELTIARSRIEGEMLGIKSTLLDLTDSVQRLRDQLRDIEIQAESRIQAQSSTATGHGGHGSNSGSNTNNRDFDPLELDRFTRFQEITRAMAESVNDVATIQQSLLRNLDKVNTALNVQARLNRSLQQELMAVRMLPFASHADRLQRLVRQTAREVGKQVSLDIRGSEVELDRSVLDRMLPPLEHMLRNAITHGLEMPAQRLAQGKPESGRITLTLAQLGNEIQITVADDGEGLNLDKIWARAQSLGRFRPGARPVDRELIDLIFDPGFSTATEVTATAGRGVGMDVVKSEVSGMGGRIEVRTASGQGSTFDLFLPVTLAVTQAMLVRVGDQTYAIPASMVEQSRELLEDELTRIRQQQGLLWQEHRYTFHYLAHLLGKVDARPEQQRLYALLLLRGGHQHLALLVDAVRGNQEIVVKHIGPQLSRVVGIDGATVLADGQVVLILNPAALASRPPLHTAGRASTEPVPAGSADLPQQRPLVMVVDDSLTVRKISSRLLEREGYDVVTAKDGSDALEKLLASLPDALPAVVLSDIDMPRMDGFELIRHLRADERLRHLPVIVITSRIADKHRNYAFEMGADHFLGKPYNEGELLQRIAEAVKGQQGEPPQQ